MRYTQSKQAALDELTFRGDRHRYSYRGLMVPSVTTVVDSQLPFQNMAPGKFEEARERGKDVHEATAWADLIALTGKGDPLYLGRWVAYLQAWWKFLKETGFQVEEVEQRVFHRKHLFAGTLDRIGSMDEKRGVLDIKTGLLYPEYAWQTAAYKAAANDGRLGGEVEKRWIVQLKADGTYVLTEHKGKKDLDVFLAALLVYNWKGQNIK